LLPRGLEVRCGTTNLEREGHPLECGAVRGIKLLERAMQVVVRIFEHRMWQQIDIHIMQFGFTKGKGTAVVIFIVRQMQEKFRAKQKSSTLAYGFRKKLMIGFREK